MYGIWGLDVNDWIRVRFHDRLAIVAYETEGEAQCCAAREYGFETYEGANEGGYCEVRLLSTPQAQPFQAT